jgi:small subunit ribosomal protein S1
VGKNITLKVIELNRRRNRAILSERAAVQERRAADKERLLQELQEGDVKTGRVTSIRDFGIFVDIGGADPRPPPQAFVERTPSRRTSCSGG